MNTVEMTKKCYEASQGKGFWDTERNPAEAFALILSELNEAFEADRKGRFANLIDYQVGLDLKSYMEEKNKEYSEKQESLLFAKHEFEKYIKDTVEDEMTDVIIRIFDFCGGFNIDPTELEATGYIDDIFKSSDNFGEKVLSLFNRATSAYYIVGTSTALKVMYQHTLYWCKELNIDIEKHIELKLQYNATRGYKHDKQY